jgi:hypothetical protein
MFAAAWIAGPATAPAGMHTKRIDYAVGPNLGGTR